MEGYGQVRLTPEQILPVVEMRERRRAEAVSRTFCHFQTFRHLQHADYFTEQNLPAANLGPRTNHTSLGQGKDIASITLVHWSGQPFHLYLSCIQLCLKLNENPTNKQKDYIIISSLWNHPVDGFPARLCYSYCLVAKSCPTFSPPGSSVHGIFQAGILEWVDISFSIFPKQGLNPRLLCLLHGRQILYHWATN